MRLEGFSRLAQAQEVAARRSTDRREDIELARNPDYTNHTARIEALQDSLVAARLAAQRDAQTIRMHPVLAGSAISPVDSTSSPVLPPYERVPRLTINDTAIRFARAAAYDPHTVATGEQHEQEHEQEDEMYYYLPEDYDGALAYHHHHQHDRDWLAHRAAANGAIVRAHDVWFWLKVGVFVLCVSIAMAVLTVAVVVFAIVVTAQRHL